MSLLIIITVVIGFFILMLGAIFRSPSFMCTVSPKVRMYVRTTYLQFTGDQRRNLESLGSQYLILHSVPIAIILATVTSSSLKNDFQNCAMHD
jgi:hypothetical protein